MLVASVNIPETLEVVYWIKKLGYRGWLTLDVFPYRENKIPAARTCFDWLRALFAAVDRVGLDRIGAVVRSGDGVEASRLVRELLMGGGS